MTSCNISQTAHLKETRGGDSQYLKKTDLVSVRKTPAGDIIVSQFHSTYKVCLHRLSGYFRHQINKWFEGSTESDACGNIFYT